jgi:murein DD-endopeptidase MepM/ murein hydrolase activator NlpD
MIQPVKEPIRISSKYGWRTIRGKRQFHDGLDYVSDSGDQSVFSIFDGTVVFDFDDYDEARRWTDNKHSGGNMIVVKYKLAGADYYVRYLHLISNVVRKGQEVKAGQLLGTYGDVGYSFGAHVHVDVYQFDWKKIDPGMIGLK